MQAHTVQRDKQELYHLQISMCHGPQMTAQLVSLRLCWTERALIVRPYPRYQAQIQFAHVQFDYCIQLVSWLIVLRVAMPVSHAFL